MASRLRELRVQARKLKIPNARELSLSELEEAISGAESNNGASTTTKARKTVAVKAVKKRGRPRKVEAEVEAPKRGRGRPKGSTTKKAETTTAPKRRGRPPKVQAEETPKRRGRPPKSETTARAKKATTTRKASGNGRVGRPPGSGSGTRVSVPDTINWEKEFAFRTGTIAGVILIELKKQANKKRNKTTADIREATIESLEGDLGSDPFVFKHRGGGRYNKSEALDMLRYRVNRTIFDYARETGQHGGGATTKRRGRPAKSETVEAPKRRGRPPKAAVTTPKRRGRPPKAEKGVAAPKKRGRPPGSGKKATAATGKRRGRPPGSKNKKM